MTSRGSSLVWIASAVLLLACASPGQQQSQVPAPRDVIGFEVGADTKLADWELITRYFQELAAASDRVQLEVIGDSTLGKEMLLAIISSAENVARREAIRDNLRRLADPRQLSEAQEKELIAQTPVVVFVGCAQHATEIASTQASMEIAHRLAVADSDADRQILENVVFLLVPSLNPDGHQMVCDWYAEQLGTPFEGGRMPWLYQTYVGHDNNRDWAMITQAESRHVSRVLYEEWFPQFVIDVHQMGRNGARMFIPPYSDPVNPNMAPLIDHELTLLTAQMRLDLSIAGHKGVVTNAMFDEWLLGYFSSVPSRHNMVPQLIEMASVNIASPIFLRRQDLRSIGNSQEYGRRSNFPEPWEGGWWRLRDIVDYEHTALISALGLAARNRETFLENFVTLGREQLAEGRAGAPFAFLVPPSQDDPATAWKMLEVLMRGGVEIHRAVAGFTADGLDYPAGTWVVLMEQPYRAHAKDLLEKQVYPDLRAYPGGPPERPYDVTGWTLSLLMGVKAVQVVAPFEARLERVARDAPLPRGEVTSLASGDRFLLLERSQNNSFVLVHRLLSQGSEVLSLTEATTVGEKEFAPGTFVIEGAATAELVEQVRSLGLEAYRCGTLPGEKHWKVDPVRLGLYQPWTASMDEGWTRWVLEQFEVPYRTVHDAEVRAGGLQQRYDAILLPDLRAGSIVTGHREGTMPREYCGGIGEEGVFALRDFVREGGTLIALDSSCAFLIDKLELPVRQVGSGGEEEERVFCPGSILSLDVDVTHPLGYGLRPATPMMFSSSPVFEEVEEKGKGKESSKDGNGQDDASNAVAFVGSYPKVNPLLSGWIENDEVLRGKGALVQAPFGKGTAVLIGFRAQFRAQSHGTYKVLFNAILSAGQIAADR